MEPPQFIKKCGFETNLQCDKDYNCLQCIREENEWARNWIEAYKKGQLASNVVMPIEMKIQA